MSIQTTVTPTGQLIVEAVIGETSSQKVLTQKSTNVILAAFSESTSTALVLLASGKPQSELPSDFIFWRGFAESFFHELRGLTEDDLQKFAAGKRTSTKIEPPQELSLIELIQNAPPMRGLEYLTPKVLRSIWGDLQNRAIQQAQSAADGPVAWLKLVNPRWKLLGRVTFHLAENKRDSERPFAFLATYTHRMSAKAGLQHLPLAEALKQYAGEKNQEKLQALLEPVRSAAKDSYVVREMLDSRRLFQPHALTVGEAHRLLSDVPEMEAAGLVMRLPDWWRTRKTSRPEVQVKIGQKESRVGADGLMSFSVALALNGEPLTSEEREQILQTTDGLAWMRGQWVEVDAVKLQEALNHWDTVEQSFGDGIEFIEGMRMLAGVQLNQEATKTDVTGWTRVTTGDWLHDTLQHLRDPAGIVECTPGTNLNATLRPYQVDGVRWLWFMTKMGLGACLADDMGLGKTIQVIDLLLILKQDAAGSKRKPKTKRKGSQTSLLVVPASLVGNWKSEFERFAPSLNVLYAHNSECGADQLRLIAKSPATTVAKFDVVVTTYGLARRLSWFEEIEWNLIVLDEAQAIKNAASAQAKAIVKLKSTGRIALSGTPVENHLGELWSLFNFCCPGLLGNSTQFKKFITKLSKRKDGQGYGSLRKLVQPYILRRMKTDPGIVPDLPEKTEMRTACGLSKKQATLYQKTISELQERLDSVEGIQRSGIVLSTLMQLKQICNHSSQFLGQSEYPIIDSGKFQRLKKICEPIVEQQERMLVFTQFQSLTEPLAEFLSSVFGRPGLVLHGGVPVKKRKLLVAEFQSDDGPPFFVISVKAGGTGLNLTNASHVVHFDRWWNPAVENQATDRAFRIGQKRNVLVHKFVCRGTVEERIDEMIRDKQELSDRILKGGAESQLTKMSDTELLDFIAIDLSRAGTDDN